jgi:hypothetical protein
LPDKTVDCPADGLAGLQFWLNHKMTDKRVSQLGNRFAVLLKHWPNVVSSPVNGHPASMGQNSSLFADWSITVCLVCQPDGVLINKRICQ